MSFVVDTCILIDIADADPAFGKASARILSKRVEEGLHLSPISYVELAPLFAGSMRLLDEFLLGLGVSSETGIDEDTRASAFSAWARHITAKRAGVASRRPVADIFIGALALQHQGLITRNAKYFQSLYPKLRIIDPAKPTRAA